MNLDDRQSIGTLGCIGTAVYFDCFGIECILQEALKQIKDKSITHNILRNNLMILSCAVFVKLLSENM